MHLTLLKYPNTKTSLYKLSKNHWVIALFKKFGSVRKKLQSTVSLDHPVFHHKVTLIIEEHWWFATISVACILYMDHQLPRAALCD